MNNKNIFTSTPIATEKSTKRGPIKCTTPNHDASLDVSSIGTLPEENRVLYNSGAVQIVTLTDREYKAILDLYANRNAAANVTAATNSPLAPELTMMEKVQRIQDYINSITPNRVDYDKKSPKLNIIAKLPLDKPGAVAGKSHKIRISMCPRTGKTIMERIDYTSTTVLGDLHRQQSSPPVKKNRSHMRLRERKQLHSKTPVKTRTGRKCRHKVLENEISAIPPTSSTVTVEGSREDLSPTNESIEDILINFAIKESTNVTIRTPRKNLQKRKSPGTSPGDNIQTVDDNSVEIISVETADENTRPHKKKSQKRIPVEVIDLCSSPEINTNDAQGKEFGENAKLAQKPILNCPICFEPLKQDISSTICGHIFCTPCIREAIKQSRQCPTCRKKLSLKRIHPIYF